MDGILLSQRVHVTNYRRPKEAGLEGIMEKDHGGVAKQVKMELDVFFASRALAQLMVLSFSALTARKH